MIKKVWRVAITIFIVNFLENLALLLVFGIKPTQQTIIGIGVFTLVLTLVLNQLNLLQKD